VNVRSFFTELKRRNVYRVAIAYAAGWSWGCVSAVDSSGRTIFVADAHGDGQRFVVRAEEKLTAFVELESQLALKGMAF
jgi:hypothetical protein